MHLPVIIFYLLFVRTYVQTDEAPALSFMSIVPKLISTVRFVQENMIDEVIEYNQTLPWFDLDDKVEINQSNCSRDFQILVQDLRERKIWAFKSKKLNFTFEIFMYLLFKHWMLGVNCQVV